MAQITDFVTGFFGPIGMALNGDDLYVVDVVASKIVKIDLTATPPTATDVVTGLSDPRQLLIDGNHIYVAETNYNKISPFPASLVNFERTQWYLEKFYQVLTVPIYLIGLDN